MSAFTDQVVLVTGGSKGIGLACARLFLQQGARVVICSRSADNVERALASLPGAEGFVADLRDEQAAAQLVQRVETQVGPIDVLVNSAGAARRTPPDELTPAFWRAAMDAKFFTTVNVLDPLVKRMAARKRGVIVNIIGAGGKVASPIHLAGGAANAALMLATAGLGHSYAGAGVRVLGISPGQTETERVAEGLAADAQLAGISPEEALQRSLAGIPLGRMARPEEVAQLALFLASEQAAYLTGITITMDDSRHPVVV
ncbi:MAG: 3alpha-hydroxy bile acid-CoA-ester 3-dehydrogenase 1/3 [Pseudomonas citronellolis]|nr:MAG: 3alpha-hydroxy bile acid-CoA-ester 3-dehydrogenase 1/3 [Pseudomonas citronellolis]